MPALYNNLYIEQGSTYNTTIIIDGIGALTGNSSSQIRKTYNSSNITATFQTTVSTLNNTITLQLSSNVTSNIVPGRYVYDAIVRNSANNTSIRVLEGIVDVSPSVTR
jgi:DNA repair ATPase RecN